MPPLPHVADTHLRGNNAKGTSDRSAINSVTQTSDTTKVTAPDQVRVQASVAGRPTLRVAQALKAEARNRLLLD